MKKIPPLLLGAVLIGAALRVSQAGESLWLDELHTSWTVTGSLGEVAERAMIGNQSPLYFWLIWFVARLPIMPEIALRLPSLVAGSALPVAIYWLTRRMLANSAAEEETTPALLAAWLTALDPLAIFYAQEARPYAILQLLAVLHIGVLLAILRGAGLRARMAWIASGALLVHLHYTAGLILLAELVVIAVCCSMSNQADGGIREQDDSWLARLTPRLIDLALVGLLISPAFFGMAEVARHRQQWTAFVTPDWPHRILTLFPCTIACIGLWFVQRWKKTVDPAALALVGGWLFVPLVVAWIFTVTGAAPLFFPRYLLAAWPASIIAAGMFWIVPRSVASRQAYLVAILVWQFYSSGLLQNWYADRRLLHDRNEDWRLAARTLEPAVQSGPNAAVVLVRSGLIEADELRSSDDPLLRDYCLLPVRGLYRIESQHDDEFYPLTYTDPGRLTKEITARLLQTDEVLLLNRTNDLKKREQLLADLQTSLGPEVRLNLAEESAEFGGVYLQRILLRPIVSQR